ncbi:hypothetical protein NBRC10512_005756 [Rhodotorula toruloides]|uniref:Uncharacterized protein n=1 Tax=Rhodotorula toruloides (strain NP11) TaxID=1130832 RepID=M7WE63_RHOT1|nr:uncharacterized protein RHTO_05637 [Rhodotorula toruloides NP11]EMS18707.1 hypothetical protein RHTO_05637 [Rhodotorula toruloides NP11]
MSSSYHLPTSTPAPGTAKPWEPFTQPRFCAVAGRRLPTAARNAPKLYTTSSSAHRNTSSSLSKREADEASAHFNYEDPSWAGNRRSIAKWLQQMLRHRVTPEILQDWTEGQKHPEDLALSQDVLGVVRENEFDRKTASTNLDNAYLDCDAFTAVHYIRSTASPSVPSPELWHEGWLHRLAILVALIQKYKAGDPAASLSICCASYQQMERFLLTAKPMTGKPYSPVTRHPPLAPAPCSRSQHDAPY